VAAWLLIGPPIRDAKPDLPAPTAEWKRYGAFPTEVECIAGRDLTLRMTGTEKYGWEKRYWSEMARCIDDAK